MGVPSGYRGPIATLRFAAFLTAAALGSWACSGCGSGTPSQATSTTTGRSSSSTTAPSLSGPLVWGTPTAVSTAPLLSASCATPSFCVAVDGGAHAYVFDGSQWSSPKALSAQGGPGGQVASVSCTSPSFCVAVPPGSDGVVTWNGATWSAPRTVSANALEGVSCVGTSFCTAVDGEGDAFEYNGSSWSRGSGDWGGISGVSCVNSSFCVSVSGGVSVFDGSSWTEPNQQGATSNFTGVSCPTTSYCLAVDALGQALTFTGTWSAPVPIEPPVPGSGAEPTPSGVSCWSAGACIVVDSAGQAIVVTNGPSKPSTIDRGHTISAVSCASTLCVAVDAQGDAVVGKR